MKILITGGASGLGRSITQLLASEDSSHVYFTYSQSASAAKELENSFKNVTAVHCDFTDEKSVAGLAEKLAGFDIDILIHNAYSGDYLKSHFHKIAHTEFLEDFRLNVMPVIRLTQEAIHLFRKKKSGKIITVLSAALHGQPPIGSSVYTSNKAYLQKLTQVWAFENAKYNITSNSVSPSFMETAMTSFMDERIKEQLIEQNPAKRLLTTAETAKAVLRLATDTTQANGQDFIINAGTEI